MLVGRKVTGNFEDAVLSLIGEEGSFLVQTEVEQSSTGLLTIGYGYPLIVSFKTKASKTAYEPNDAEKQEWRDLFGKVRAQLRGSVFTPAMFDKVTGLAQ